jgi:hypothetical protein
VSDGGMERKFLMQICPLAYCMLLSLWDEEKEMENTALGVLACVYIGWNELVGR